ncbi:MAG: ABC transporter ATP-binding protein [Planctomycetales bacterium]|jgi:ABC-2 type transport system ATP-binding protein
MIRLSGITQHYGVRPVLKDLNLEIGDSGVTAIVGPNGMGKTTLLSVLAGVLTPQHGTVEINGLIRRSTEKNELEIRRQAVFLPDRPWLPKQRTGREFLLSVGALYGVETEQLFDHIERLFQLFNLAKEADWPVRSYSNGQQKKLSLSAALVTEARILLLDEPFGGGLDPAGILALKHVLRRLTQEQGYCVVLTAPAPELIEELADKFVVLREGRIVAHDTVEGLRHETGLGGPLSDVLASLTSPETLDNVEDYFAGGRR